MDILELSLGLGVLSVYFAFAGGFGFVIRRTLGQEIKASTVALTVAYFTVLFLPATAFVLGIDDWSTAAKVGIVASAATVIWITTAQPAWIPGQLWRRAWGYVYLSLAMAFSALWGITFGLASSANPAFFLGVISLAAGSTALKNTYPSLSNS
jgi:hypothetical protein